MTTANQKVPLTFRRELDLLIHERDLEGLADLLCCVEHQPVHRALVLDAIDQVSGQDIELEILATL